MTPQAEASLAQLRDIHLPEPVAAWPPAPGWWLLAAGILAAALAAAWLWRRRRRASVRREAADELLAAEQRFRDSRDPAALAADLSSLLRRVALAHRPRGEVATARGERWVGLLADAERGAGIPRDVGAAIERAIYVPAARGPDASDCDAWIESVRHWIRRNA